MNKMYCPKCGKELTDRKDRDFVYHFWCDECLIDINVEENCLEPLEDWDDWDYNENCGFDPYMGCYTDEV